MNLVTRDEVAALSAQLAPEGGLRVARLDATIDPFDFARTGAALVDRAVAMALPSGDRLVGLGTAWHRAERGQDRFRRIREAIGGIDDEDLVLFFGYSFLDEIVPGGRWQNYAPAEAFIPRIGIQRIGGRTKLVIAIPPGERPEATLDLLSTMKHPEPIPVVDFGDHTIESHPGVAEWAGIVDSARKVIEAGELDKVVLARSVRVTNTEPVAILRVFRQLVASYPQCYTFAWKSGDSVFMGSSPELLARVVDGEFRSNPLAGSAARGEGEEEDAEIGSRLLRSAKDQEEHRLVVTDMAERLGSLVPNLTVPPSPSLKKMATVQHLSTVMEGHVGGGVGVIDVVDAVHPTPAVGGVPRARAIAHIAAHEGIDRGWYTGGIGWVSPGGNGEVAIGLRCGLIDGATTDLFAGAGIVADSDPASEVVETRLKLRPLLDLIAAT